MPPPLSRRRLLGLGGALAVGAGTGACSGSPGLGEVGRGGGATCVPRSSLTGHRTLAGLPLIYQVNERRSDFFFEDGFYGRLEAWAESLADLLPSRPEELWTYGSWTDGGSACDSWHHAGRAFDVARLPLADGSVVSCRHDLWRSFTGSQLTEARRRYWALAAGLHRRFAYVLTYLYDDQHANHIHVDDGRSGNANSTFSSRSEVQVQAVQAICTYLWDEPVELTGRWDTATRTATARVLTRLDLDDSLTAPGSWTGFLAASAGRVRD